MAEIVNLRRVKKRLARAADAAQAAENRVRHGLTGPQKAADQRAAARRDAQAEGHRLDPSDGRQPDPPTRGT